FAVRVSNAGGKARRSTSPVNHAGPAGSPLGLPAGGDGGVSEHNRFRGETAVTGKASHGRKTHPREGQCWIRQRGSAWRSAAAAAGLTPVPVRSISSRLVSAVRWARLWSLIWV